MRSSLEHQLGSKAKIGPYSFRIESTSAISETTRDLLESIAKLPGEVLLENVRGLENDPGVAKLAANCSVQGRTTVNKVELAQAVERSAHASQSSSWRGERGRVATTIHGAKNREFDYVAVLWPYEVSGDNEYQRRLLYNGITRAKRDAIVLVQGAGRGASKSPLFGLLLG